MYDKVISSEEKLLSVYPRHLCWAVLLALNSKRQYVTLG